MIWRRCKRKLGPGCYQSDRPPHSSTHQLRQRPLKHLFSGWNFVGSAAIISKDYPFTCHSHPLGLEASAYLKSMNAKGEPG